MINFKEVLPGIQENLWDSYVNDAATPWKIIGAFNDAVEYIAETVLRDSFIFEYTFTATGDRNEYTLPVIFSLRDIQQWDVFLKKDIDWVHWEDKNIYDDKVAVGRDKIWLPDSTDTRIYTIQYRGTPTRVDADVESTFSVNLPRNFQKALEPLTAHFIFKKAKQYDYANAAFSDYLAMIDGTKWAFHNRHEKTVQRMSSNHKF